jgi:hypothetical protein
MNKLSSTLITEDLMDSKRDADRRNAALLEENAALRDQLAAANDKLTAANEQLTAANEQLTTANEQLTATNEQLTKANEKIASASTSQVPPPSSDNAMQTDKEGKFGHKFGSVLGVRSALSLVRTIE